MANNKFLMHGTLPVIGKDNSIKPKDITNYDYIPIEHKLGDNSFQTCAIGALDFTKYKFIEVSELVDLQNVYLNTIMMFKTTSATGPITLSQLKYYDANTDRFVNLNSPTEFAKDFVLIIDRTNSADTGSDFNIIFSQAFIAPRTSPNADYRCVHGKLNIYHIYEYIKLPFGDDVKTSEFIVDGWSIAH